MSINENAEPLHGGNIKANQQIFRVRRNYNQWVVDQTLEDYALRFTAKESRRWSAGKVAMTALGASAFLALEALGGAITVSYGFTNALMAILWVSAIIFITGLPICYYASRYGVDIDLLTRGAGFGYLGSTITSLIYASFTYIFFAIEAVILSSALEALFSIPLYIGYIISAVLVIPIVTHGITFISKFQVATQPLWLILQVVAIITIVYFEIDAINDWTSFVGVQENFTADHSSFDLILFGAASAILFALIAQNGEQVDYLRFLPEKENISTLRWWGAMLLAGPGWVIIGIIKLLLGSFLAYLAFSDGASLERAADPVYMYQLTFNLITQNETLALALAGFFVIICQMKINVTNAYAGSIAWSNFFSRLTHNHPGRVVWLIFNVAIALLLMELGIYRALENILGLFAIIAVSWLGTIATDLTINKALGLAPKGIEFKRAHLYDINPVGVGSLLISTMIGVLAYLNFFGEEAKALAHFITLGMTLVCAPAIAWLTQGKYYIARTSPQIDIEQEKHQCCICEHHYEPEDMSHCPAYQGSICSLCCTLDARCLDSCKTNARFSEQIIQYLSTFLPQKAIKFINSKLMHFLSILTLISLFNGGLLSLIYYQIPTQSYETLALIADAFWIIFFILVIISGVLTWVFLLAHGSRIVAQEESQTQTLRLLDEIEAHTQTDKALQDAMEKAEAANQAKSRYLSGISHELRTPLQTILGYSQLLGQDKSIPEKRRESINIIQRSGDHLAGLIEGLLDVSKIEAGKLEIRRDEMNFHELMSQMELMFAPQAREKNIDFIFNLPKKYPQFVIADEKRLRQILINLLSNAIKFTHQGSVSLALTYRNQVAEFTVSDTGIGIKPENIDKVFHPFERALEKQARTVPGTGLGLTIVHLLTDIMGGEVTVESTLNKGSTFKVSLMLAPIDSPLLEQTKDNTIIAYQGLQKTIAVVDDQAAHRHLIRDLLTPLGFTIVEANDAHHCLSMVNSSYCDLFLLDVSMPGMNGIDLAKTLRRQKITQPIIMLSADAQEHLQIDDPNTAHDAYMVKPIKIHHLLEKIGRLLKLEWQYEKTPIAKIDAPIHKQWAIPAHPYIMQLIAYADIGYAKGFYDKLTLAESENILPSELVQHLYRLAKQVRYDTISHILNQESYSHHD